MTRTALVVLAAALLAACGQKGSLYLPDQGLQAVPAGAPAPTTGADGAPANAANEGAAGAAPVTPATPDRPDEARKRIPSPPDPAKSP